MRILVADADRSTIETMRRVFKAGISNCDVVTADSGAKCLDVVKHEQLDIVILGTYLPDMSGLEVIENIRSCSKSPVCNIPIMVISYVSEGPLVNRAFELGVNGFMTKPVHHLELIERIKALIRRTEGRVKTS